jgi:uncharacterized protein YndB with AHSA1/START domain
MPHTLQLEQFVAAPPARVLRWWTDARRVAKWMPPTGVATVHAWDARPGGAFRVALPAPQGTATAVGSFKEVGPDRLAFRWDWVENPLPGPTVVTVDLRATNEGTRLLVTHGGFADAETAKAHEDGWKVSLANLAKRV